MSVRDALIRQKRELELRRQENYTDRTAVFRAGDDHLIRIVIGPRRAGKSTFITRHLMENGPFTYINFDDEELAQAGDLSDILAAAQDVYDGTKVLLLDEIQNIPGWELAANRLARQGYRVYITGSNAHLLSKELATHLTGRHTVTTIFSFSFVEFLKTRPGEKTTSELRACLSAYSRTGGFPEILLTTVDKKEYLSRLFDAEIYKDIVQRYRIRSPQGLDSLAQYLCSNAAREYSVHRLAQVTGCKSDQTLKKYLGYLEDAFLFFSVPRFSYKMREQVLANRKIYCIDNGFITAKGFGFSKNDGMLMENLVAIELHRREFSGEHTLYYWKNAQQYEVDFVIHKNRRVTSLIQVCTDSHDDTTLQREVRALLLAGRDLDCRDRVILTVDHEETKTEEWYGIKGEIRFIPLTKWFVTGELANKDAAGV